MPGVFVDTLIRVLPNFARLRKTKGSLGLKPLIENIVYQPLPQLNLGRLVEPRLRHIKNQKAAGYPTEDRELDQESTQVLARDGIVEGPVPGVEHDLAVRGRADDNDDGDAEQHDLGPLWRGPERPQ